MYRSLIWFCCGHRSAKVQWKTINHCTQKMVFGLTLSPVKVVLGKNFALKKNCLKVGTLLSIIKSRRMMNRDLSSSRYASLISSSAIISYVVIKGRVILIKQLQGKCCSLLGYHLCPFPTCKLLCAPSAADPNMSSEMKHWRCTFFKSVDHILRHM